MLTVEQAEMLHKAVDLAKKPGGCAYITDEGPECIIGQLGALHGVTNKKLKSWYSVFSVTLLASCPGADVLTSYPEHILSDLQRLWDTGSEQKISEVRTECHTYITKNTP